VYLNEAGSPPNTEAALAAFLRGNNAVLQTSFLLFFVALAVWFVFFAGLRSLLARSMPGLEYLGTSMFGLGAAICILTFVSLGLQAAATATASAALWVPPTTR